MNTPAGRDRCAGCLSSERAHLDVDLVAGVSLRKLADRYKISRSALHRHRLHVSASLVRVNTAPRAPVSVQPNGNGADPSLDVVTEARKLYDDMRGVLDRAMDSGNVLQLSLAAREVHRSLDLLGRQIERLEERRGGLVVIDVQSSPEWIAIRNVIYQELKDHPEIKFRIVAALAALDEASNGRSA